MTGLQWLPTLSNVEDCNRSCPREPRTALKAWCSFRILYKSIIRRPKDPWQKTEGLGPGGQTLEPEAGVCTDRPKGTCCDLCRKPGDVTQGDNTQGEGKDQNSLKGNIQAPSRKISLRKVLPRKMSQNPSLFLSFYTIRTTIFLQEDFPSPEPGWFNSAGRIPLRLTINSPWHTVCLILAFIKCLKSFLKASRESIEYNKLPTGVSCIILLQNIPKQILYHTYILVALARLNLNPENWTCLKLGGFSLLKWGLCPPIGHKKDQW